MIRKSSNRHPTCQDTESYAVRWLHLWIDAPVGRLQLQVDVLVGRSNPSENIGGQVPSATTQNKLFSKCRILILFGQAVRLL